MVEKQVVMRHVKKKPHRPLFCGFVLLWVFSLQPSVSWSQSDPELVLIQGAKREGRIVWYNVISLEHSKVMMERFQKKYPFIKLELVRTGTGPLLNRILNETRAGRHGWDVVIGSAEIFLPLLERKLVGRYNSPERKMYDDDMRDKENFWTTLYANPIVLGFNTRLVREEEAPRSYDDLLSPKWKGGKISIDAESL
jgi:iron(III) transport system substrate-binding protein